MHTCILLMQLSTTVVYYCWYTDEINHHQGPEIEQKVRLTAQYIITQAQYLPTPQPFTITACLRMWN